jgi:hypothetical protein
MFINLTPHTLNVQKADGSFITIPPSGQVARVTVTYKEVRQVSGVSVFSPHYGEVVGLPKMEDDNLYIVSLLVKQAAPGLGLLSPGELIRDEKGNPIGCKGLC